MLQAVRTSRTSVGGVGRVQVMGMLSFGLREYTTVLQPTGPTLNTAELLHAGTPKSRGTSIIQR
jgi:hypothetical protein